MSKSAFILVIWICIPFEIQAKLSLEKIPYFGNRLIDEADTIFKSGSYNDIFYANDTLYNEIGEYLGNKRVGLWLKVKNGILDSFILYDFGCRCFAGAVSNYRDCYYNKDSLRRLFVNIVAERSSKITGYYITTSDRTVKFEYYNESLLAGPAITFRDGKLVIVARYESNLLEDLVYWYDSKGVATPVI